MFIYNLNGVINRAKVDAGKGAPMPPTTLPPLELVPSSHTKYIRISTY